MPRYVIRKSRFLADAVVDGRRVQNELVFASPEYPKEVELPEGTKEDGELYPVGSKEATEKLKPHYVEKVARQTQSAKDIHSKPLSEQGKGKRPSDGEP